MRENPSKASRLSVQKTVNDLCMLVDFSNGETRLFDATLLSDNPAFAPLADQSPFSKFNIEHGVPCWLDGAIESPRVLRRLDSLSPTLPA